MNTIPKSLHTVRVFVLVARRVFPSASPKVAAVAVAKLFGYDDAKATDPVVVATAKQLARE